MPKAAKRPGLTQALGIMKRTIAAGTLLALLSSCAVYSDELAQAECFCAGDQPEKYQVALTAQTGHWRWSVHSFSPYREIATLSFRLPEKPKKTIRYDASQLVVVDTSTYPETTIPIRSGYIELRKERFTVMLQESDGSFWANGTYGLK